MELLVNASIPEMLEDEESGAPDGEDEETEVTRHAGLEDALEGLAEKITAGLFPQENITPENPAVKNWAAKGQVAPDTFVRLIERELDGMDEASRTEA